MNTSPPDRDVTISRDAQDAAPSILSRRSAIAALGAGVAGITATSHTTASTHAAQTGRSMHGILTDAEVGWDAAAGTYRLPTLPYAYDALEPAIDARTMEIHHSKHHAGYIRGMGTALEQLTAIRAGEVDARLVKHWSQELSFHASGHVNHALFWTVMAPPDSGGGGRPEGRLADLIQRDFGGFDGFRSHFVGAAASVEGSGWGWLVWDPMAARLMVIQGEKQQNLMITGVLPILGIDVWEHAYYLAYQNRRRDYCTAFFDVVNWSKVSELLERVAPAS